jgi:hypothetical protein
MMVDRGTRDAWICKRDPAIRIPRHQAIRYSEEGIPYLAPAAVLLFKAKYQRPKDERDFSLALRKLDNQEREDLRNWILQCHPEHDWLQALQ